MTIGRRRESTTSLPRLWTTLVGCERDLEIACPSVVGSGLQSTSMTNPLEQLCKRQQECKLVPRPEGTIWLR